ncbi:MAG TPA: hypothetical protein DCG75_03760 [Bacteroidales bacterium]|nr:hypothetical protein [Bacteroidales bacterium]
MKHILLVCFFFLILHPIFSQESDTLQNEKEYSVNDTLKFKNSTKKYKSFILSILNVQYDISRISDLTNRFNIYTGLIGKFHSIELENPDINKKLKYEPNGNTSIMLGFNYKWLGLGFNFSPGFLNKDDEIYGESSRFDTQLNIYTKSFGIDAHLQYYKGFYLKNPDKFIDWQNDFYPQRTDLESLSFGLSAYYFFNNKKFSYKAAFNRTQVQKKSAGSFILGTYVNAIIVNSPGGFIPTELPDSLLAFYNLDAYVTNSVGVSGGYTYTLVFLKNFFINASLVPGFGYRSATFQTNENDTKVNGSITGSLNARVALGYEGKHLYAGLTFVSFVDSYNYESISISSSTGNIRFFIGTRLNVGHLFKKKTHSSI